MIKHKHKTYICALLLFCVAGSVYAKIPPPAETPCEVVMSGRTITLKSITIVPVGQEIPETYSSSVKNTPGMSWYVSQHYALKTDHGEATARRFLTYAELAYPFHVWIIGRHPSNQDRLRMPFVMGSNLNKTLDAIQGDGGFRPNNICGGITYWGMNTAYNYPSGTQQYHQRDLVIHENLHLMQMCCGSAYTPVRLLEGITHTSCNHVYDEKKRQLTLAVFDKPTVNYPTTDQLRQIRGEYKTFREVCQAGYGYITLYTSFMWSDPDRLMKWRLWRDAMQWEGRAGEDIKVMEELFGNLDGQIEQDWKAWVDARQATFHYRDWGWEQSADTLIAYGWPQHGPYSRTDILLPPGEKPEYDPLRMDYPLQPMSPLVGPVRRGVEEPTVGALASFARCPGRGLGGIGLGVQTERPTSELSYMPLLIQGGNALVMQGRDLGMPDETVPFPGELKQAMAAGGHQIGLTAKIGKDALVVTLRAQDPATNTPVEFVKSWPINAEQRKRLLSCPGTILAKDGYQKITPYFDDARRPEAVDLSIPSPGNKWRFEGDDDTYRLYRAMQKLKDQTPKSLNKLAKAMVEAMDKDKKAQQAVMKKYAQQLPDVLQDIRAVESVATDSALAELAGASIKLAFDKDSTFEKPRLTVSIPGPVSGKLRGNVTFTVMPPDIMSIDTDCQSFTALPGEMAEVTWGGRGVSSNPAPFSVAVHVDLDWNGTPFVLTSDIVGCPSISKWLTIGPFDNKGDGTVDTAHSLETEPFDPQKKYVGKNDKEIVWEKRERPADSPLESEFLLDFASMYGGDNIAAYALTWINSPVETDVELALGSDDGVAVWLNEEKIHTNMVARGYSSKQDRVPIHLKAGKNKLLIKVAQGGGGWSLCAHILNKDGVIMPGMIYELSGVPSPRELPAKVTVSGNISTVEDIGIVPVGLEIPVTYSGTAVRNTPGFSWWVSKHYALKTDYDADLAELYLTLLELTYPHYVELFSGEPEGIENTRMTAVYASSGAQLEIAMASDGINWTYPGGGITYDTHCTAYQFQCYPVEFVWDQPRYILLHECAHLFQICMYGSLGNTPYWYYEGVADRIASHVYDPDRNQLTVNVFDKAGPLHMPDIGLDKIKQSGLTMEELIPRNCLGDRGVNVVVCTFLNSTPDLMQKFRLWRDAIIANGGDVCATMEECFGPWQKLNLEFGAWIDARQTTFWTEGRQWSQEADTLWATASHAGSTNWSFKEVNLPPGRQADPDPWRLDHPAQDMPSIVGPVKRGVAEPSVGCVVDLSKGPDSGHAGMALGVVRAGEADEGMLKLLISAEHALVIDGETIGISNFTEVFPEKVKRAMVAGGHRAGITAVIGRKALRIIVRARDPKASKDVSFKTTVPLSRIQRDRLLEKPLGLLAQGGHHGVTHFFNPGRAPLPDLLVPASPDPWRNPGDKQLYSLYRAERALGEKTPRSLLDLKQEMLDAVDKNRALQDKALNLYNKRLPDVVDDVGSCGAVPEIRETAFKLLFKLLTGMSLELDIVAGDGPSEVLVSATLHGPKSGETTGTVVIAGNFMSEQVSEPVRCGAGEKAVFYSIGRIADVYGPVSAHARADLVWDDGRRVVLSDVRAVNTSIPNWLTIGPFDNNGDGTVNTAHSPEIEPFDPEQKYTGRDSKEIGWEKRERSPDLPITSEFLLNFASLYGGNNVAAYARTWICSPVETDAVLALGSDDGVVVWLNGECVHSNMVGRAYSSKQDRVPVHLKAGRNSLLVKVAQGGGAWSLCAHILDSDCKQLHYDILLDNGIVPQTE